MSASRKPGNDTRCGPGALPSHLQRRRWGFVVYPVKAERLILEREAKRAGVTLSRWTLDAALEKARKG
jgi:hypothetical protein